MKVLSLGLSFLLMYDLPAGRAQELPPVPKPQMEIVVLEGEGAVNNVRSRQAHPITVQVRDGNRNPAPGAIVLFTLPAQGASAEFVNGAKTATITADDQGRAVARLLRPNSVPGKMDIRVNASHKGETAAITVTQFNMAVEAKGGSGKWIALALMAGGAAAGGAVALTRKSQPAATTPAAVAAPISITAGSSAVGPPR